MIVSGFYGIIEFQHAQAVISNSSIGLPAFVFHFEGPASLNSKKHSGPSAPISYPHYSCDFI
jgi:hypothetical protein